MKRNIASFFAITLFCALTVNCSKSKPDVISNDVTAQYLDKMVGSYSAVMGNLIIRDNGEFESTSKEEVRFLDYTKDMKTYKGYRDFYAICDVYKEGKIKVITDQGRLQLVLVTNDFKVRESVRANRGSEDFESQEICERVYGAFKKYGKDKHKIVHLSEGLLWLEWDTYTRSTSTDPEEMNDSFSYMKKNMSFYGSLFMTRERLESDDDITSASLKMLGKEAFVPYQYYSTGEEEELKYPKLKIQFDPKAKTMTLTHNKCAFEFTSPIKITMKENKFYGETLYRDYSKRVLRTEETAYFYSSENHEENSEYCKEFEKNWIDTIVKSKFDFIAEAYNFYNPYFLEFNIGNETIKVWANQ